MSATRKLKKKRNLEARLAKSRQGKTSRIGYAQRQQLATEGKNLCGYLRHQYMDKKLGVPRGDCALKSMAYCEEPHFEDNMSTGIGCPIYRAFLDYRKIKQDVPTDMEEFKAYLTNVSPNWFKNTFRKTEK